MEHENCVHFKNSRKQTERQTESGQKYIHSIQNRISNIYIFSQKKIFFISLVNKIFIIIRKATLLSKLKNENFLKTNILLHIKLAKRK